MHRGRTIKVPLEVTPDELSRAEEERKRELSVLIPLRLHWRWVQSSNWGAYRKNILTDEWSTRCPQRSCRRSLNLTSANPRPDAQILARIRKS